MGGTVDLISQQRSAAQSKLLALSEIRITSRDAKSILVSVVLFWGYIKSQFMHANHPPNVWLQSF